MNNFSYSIFVRSLSRFSIEKNRNIHHIVNQNKTLFKAVDIKTYRFRKIGFLWRPTKAERLWNNMSSSTGKSWGKDLTRRWSPRPNLSLQVNFDPARTIRVQHYTYKKNLVSTLPVYQYFFGDLLWRREKYTVFPFQVVVIFLTPSLGVIVN